jgi:hypothetical protein
MNDYDATVLRYSASSTICAKDYFRTTSQIIFH